MSRSGSNTLKPKVIYETCGATFSNQTILSDRLNPIYSKYACSPTQPASTYKLTRGVLSIPLDGQPVNRAPVYTRYRGDGAVQCCQLVPVRGAVYWEPEEVRNMQGGHVTLDPLCYCPLDSMEYGYRDQDGMWIPRFEVTPLWEYLAMTELPDVNPNVKLTLIAMDTRAAYGGRVNSITIRELCDTTGYSKDTTIKHVDKLLSLKLIKEYSKSNNRKQWGSHIEDQERAFQILLGYQIEAWKGASFCLISPMDSR